MCLVCISEFSDSVCVAQCLCGCSFVIEKTLNIYSVHFIHLQTLLALQWRIWVCNGSYMWWWGALIGTRSVVYAGVYILFECIRHRRRRNCGFSLVWIALYVSF